MAAASPLLVLSFGGVGVGGAGLRAWPLGILVIGGLLLGVVLYDYPMWVVFTPAGIERRCLLRTERIRWERVAGLVRPAYKGRFRSLVRTSTGLAAEVGRRRYLLTDRMESRAEYEALLRALGAWSRGTPVEASMPPDDWPPTWLYKRRRGAASTSLVDWL
jgi:hypothetical protein